MVLRLRLGASLQIQGLENPIVRNNHTAANFFDGMHDTTTSATVTTEVSKIKKV